MVHRTQRFDRRAFSLVEVMFAIAILGVGLIAIAALFPVGLVQQKRAWDDANSVIVGQNVIALVQAYVADRGSGSFAASQPTFTPFTEPAGFPAYTDPVGTYDYVIAYRRPVANGAIEIAVFVFRTPSGGSASWALVTAGVPVDTNGNMTLDAGWSYGTSGHVNLLEAHQRNQVVLLSTAGSSPRSYAVRVVKGDPWSHTPSRRVAGLVAPPPPEATADVLFLRDTATGDNNGDGFPDSTPSREKTVTIVTGVVQ